MQEEFEFVRLIALLKGSQVLFLSFAQGQV